MSFIFNTLEFLKTFIFSKSIIFLALGIIGVGCIVAFHELGHFLFCKLFNIRTPSFSIGMGPKILTKRIGETEFSISAIPMGGYVEIATPEDNTPAGTTDFFVNKPYWQKMIVLSGGIVFNIIFAYTVFSLLFLTGMPNSSLVYPENARPIIAGVVEGSPAQTAGLTVHDKILSIDGTPINDSVEELFKIIHAKPNQKTSLVVDRSGSHMTIGMILGEQKVGDTSMGYMGVEFETVPLPPASFTSAIKKGVALTHMILFQTLSVFKWMFKERHIKGLGGPIMIFSQTMQHAERGIKIFLAFLAIISINLAIINLVPLPIFDGGQAFLETLQAILRRSLPSRTKEAIMIGTWILILGLTLYLSFKDVILIRKMRSEAPENVQKDSIK